MTARHDGGRGGLSAAPPEEYRDRLLGKLDDILEPVDIDPAALSGPERATQPEAAEAERGLRVTPGGMFPGSTFPGAEEGAVEGSVANGPTFGSVGDFRLSHSHVLLSPTGAGLAGARPRDGLI